MRFLACLFFAALASSAIAVGFTYALAAVMGMC